MGWEWEREGEEEREGKGEGEEERDEAMEESPMIVREGVEPSGASRPWLRSSSISDSTSSSSGLSWTAISEISLIRSSTERLPSSSTGDMPVLGGGGGGGILQLLVFVVLGASTAIYIHNYYIGGCFFGP